MANNMLDKAAASFQASRLWLAYPDNALFSVRYPDGETGFCGVMGGSQPSLMVYPGDAGLSSLFRLRTLPADAHAYRVHEAVARQDCLVCALPENAEPIFRKHQAYAAAIPVEGTKDEEYLTHALLAAALLAGRLHELAETMPAGDAWASVGLDAQTQTIPQLTVQALSENGFTYSAMQMPQESRIILDAPTLDEEAAQAMRQIETNAEQALLVELVISPALVPGNPPTYPVGLLLADPEEGIVGMPVVENYPEDYTDLVAGLLSFCMEHGKPYRMQARDDTTYLLLEAIAKQIGLPLELARDLPMLEALKADFYDSVTIE